MKIFSTYNLIARVFPTIIGLIPLFIFQYVFLNNIVSINSVVASAIGNISLSTILLFAFTQYFVRIPSKIFEDFLFKNQLHFPTTSFLMFQNDEYSTEFKEKIRKLVKKDFSIQLPNLNEEKSDEINSRKRIKDCIRLMITKLKDGHLLLQHNIEYGFVRNLWGASLIGFITAILLAFISTNGTLLDSFSKILVLIYALYLFLGFIVIKYFAKTYARKLLEEYGSTQ